MTDAHTLSADDQHDRLRSEMRRARECAAEPIRTIGRIQSHGILFAVDELTDAVVMTSENASRWLGLKLRGAGDATFDWALSHSLALDPVRAEFDGQPYDVVVHRGTSPLIVELEPVVVGLDYVRTGVVGAIQRLASMTDPDELQQTAAHEIKRITGYDRVMCYQFHEDGHGQVVADEREPDMESYFGLHFPASDIPSQARALYLEKRSRVIADTDDPGLGLETILNPAHRTSTLANARPADSCRRVLSGHRPLNGRRPRPARCACARLAFGRPSRSSPGRAARAAGR